MADRGSGCAVCPPPTCVCALLVPRGSGLGVWAVLCAPLPVLVQISVWLEVSWDWDSAAGNLVSGITRLGCRSTVFLHLCAVLVLTYIQGISVPVPCWLGDSGEGTLLLLPCFVTCGSSRALGF